MLTREAGGEPSRSVFIDCGDWCASRKRSRLAFMCTGGMRIYISSTFLFATTSISATKGNLHIRLYNIDRTVCLQKNIDRTAILDFRRWSPLIRYSICGIVLCM